MTRLRIGAHRGAMAYQPENTLAAFETAIEQGAYRIEFDIRQTRDGHLVVQRDEDALLLLVQVGVRVAREDGEERACDDEEVLHELRLVSHEHA